MSGHCPTFRERWSSASNYVRAINDLPPTYTIGDKFRFHQFIPDPVSPQEMQRKLDDVTRAKAKLEEVQSRVRACKQSH
jgi:hypothetical protein